MCKLNMSSELGRELDDTRIYLTDLSEEAQKKIQAFKPDMDWLFFTIAHTVEPKEDMTQDEIDFSAMCTLGMYSLKHL